LPLATWKAVTLMLSSQGSACIPDVYHNIAHRVTGHLGSLKIMLAHDIDDMVAIGPSEEEIVNF
jgi:hypothetical protein